MSTRKGCDRVSRRLATSFLLCGLFALFAGCTPLGSVPQGAKDSAAAGHRRIDAKDASISITVPDSWREKSVAVDVLLAAQSSDAKVVLLVLRHAASDAPLNSLVHERVRVLQGSAANRTLFTTETRHFYSHDPPIPMSIARYRFLAAENGRGQTVVVGTVKAPDAIFELVGAIEGYGNDVERRAKFRGAPAELAADIQRAEMESDENLGALESAIKSVVLAKYPPQAVP